MSTVEHHETVHQPAAHQGLQSARRAGDPARIVEDRHTDRDRAGTVVELRGVLDGAESDRGLRGVGARGQHGGINIQRWFREQPRRSSCYMRRV